MSNGAVRQLRYYYKAKPFDFMVFESHYESKSKTFFTIVRNYLAFLEAILLIFLYLESDSVTNKMWQEPNQNDYMALCFSWLVKVRSYRFHQRRGGVQLEI